MPQNFIEANIELICTLLFGCNQKNNENLAVTFNDNGGFAVTIYEKKSSNNYLGSFIKDKIVAQQITDRFIEEKNKIIALKILKNKSNYPFFPKQFMKAVSVCPEYIEGKAGKLINAWTVFYKIVVNAYENSSMSRTEYVNIINTGITLKINSLGKITNLSYNLLPFELTKSEDLYKVVSYENEVPKLTYLLDKETNTIAPYYFEKTKEKYIPASKESYLKRFNEKIKLNSTEFNQNRVVVWLNRIKKDEFDVTEAMSLYKGINSTLPSAAKLIRLKPKDEYTETTDCIYWWNGKYEKGTFYETDLINNNNNIDENSGLILQNDIENLLYRLNNFPNYIEITDDNGEYPDKDFQKVINEIKSFSDKNIASGLTYDNFQKIKKKIESDINIDISDKPGSLENIINVISKIYNRNYWADAVLIIPLSLDWYNSNENQEVKKIFEEKYGSKRFTDRFSTWPAERVLEDDLGALKTLFTDLKETINSCSNQIETPETKWLKSFDENSFTNKTVLIIGNEMWKISHENRYACFIPIENSFGPFRLPGLLSCIIHELFCSAVGFLRFSSNKTEIRQDIVAGNEIDPDVDVKNVWEKYANTNHIEELIIDQDYMDILFQTQRAYAALVLRIIIEIISTK